MDDLISRQMLLEYIHGEPVGRLLCDKYNLDGLIEQLPPAQLSTNLAEVSTDCISREQAIDALRKMQTYKMFSGDDMLLIDQAGAMTELMLLPPIQPEPHWIPVTERLPEKFDYYLVSGINSVWFARYESGRFLGILSGHALDTVIAWMPLLEPYKGVTDGRD